MSSPIVSAVQPGIVGTSIARLVLPHADGNAAAMYFDSPSGLVNLRISMCSASQPSSRAITDAMRSAKHFLPSSALPPYPDPYDMISRLSGKCTMYLFSASHGHGTSASPSARGAPTEWTQRTHSPSPSTSSAPWPIRVMIRMLVATYAESVSWTPMWAIGEPSGPIENGTTYIVRPCMAPAKRRFSSARISSGSRQLLLGPASSSVAEQMNVRPSTRATSPGSEWAQ